MTLADRVVVLATGSSSRWPRRAALREPANVRRRVPRLAAMNLVPPDARAPGGGQVGGSGRRTSPSCRRRGRRVHSRPGSGWSSRWAARTGRRSSAAGAADGPGGAGLRGAERGGSPPARGPGPGPLVRRGQRAALAGTARTAVTRGDAGAACGDGGGAGGARPPGAPRRQCPVPSQSARASALRPYLYLSLAALFWAWQLRGRQGGLARADPLAGRPGLLALGCSPSPSCSSSLGRRLAADLARRSAAPGAVLLPARRARGGLLQHARVRGAARSPPPRTASCSSPPAPPSSWRLRLRGGRRPRLPGGRWPASAVSLARRGL